MKSVTEFFQKEIEIIRNDTALSFYGVVLCLVHIVTAYSWWNNSFTYTICSPLFQECEAFSKILLSNSKVFLSFYGLLSFFSAVMFVRTKTGLAYVTFGIVTVMKMLFHLSDYRFMGNYHYIAHIMNFVFLFVFHKKDILKFFLVLFYASAGILKFNSDWLSGAVINTPFIFKGKLLEWALVYVIFLELGFSWFLLSRHKFLRILVLIQFYLFHALSWQIVGYFYPVIMGLFLVIFILDSKEGYLKVLNRPEWAVVTLFILAQLLPFAFYFNSSLDGQGRIVSLNMFDARSLCHTSLFLKYEKRTIEYNPKFDRLGIRIHCDPAVVVSQIRRTCDDQKNKPGFLDIDVNHQVKRMSETEVPVNLTYSNVCSRPLRLSLLGTILGQSP